MSVSPVPYTVEEYRWEEYLTRWLQIMSDKSYSTV